MVLRSRGHLVFACRSEASAGRRRHWRWLNLEKSGVVLGAFEISRFAKALVDAVQRFTPALTRPARWLHHQVLALRLRLIRPDLVVISQGQAFDGCFPLSIPEICRFAGIAYVLICQKASELYWPDDRLRFLLRSCYQCAEVNFFVSYHNRRLVAQQLALDLHNAEVVQNPFCVPYNASLSWPVTPSDTFRLACVGRMWPLEKGQDLLLNVLAMSKWRDRKLAVSFYGEGPMREGLKQLAQLLGLDNVDFPGFAEPLQIWKTHHALVLPCRAEGLPLAQVEAMLCARPVIIAEAGGTNEIMRDGVHGFLASGANHVALDEALERAWHRRKDWEAIGRAGAAYVRSLTASDPCAAFADRLESMLKDHQKGA